MRATSRTVEHVGEWRLALEADTLEELFVEVARIVAKALGTVRTGDGEWESVVVTARTLPTLLVDWANELIGRSEVSGRAYDGVRNVRIRQEAGRGSEIAAEVCGRPVDIWTSPLKAATYHDFDVAQRDGRWYATLLFDV